LALTGVRAFPAAYITQDFTKNALYLFAAMGHPKVAACSCGKLYCPRHGWCFSLVRFVRLSEAWVIHRHFLAAATMLNMCRLLVMVLQLEKLGAVAFQNSGKMFLGC
jgi:hypothetical protein